MYDVISKKFDNTNYGEYESDLVKVGYTLGQIGYIGDDDRVRLSICGGEERLIILGPLGRGGRICGIFGGVEIETDQWMGFPEKYVLGCNLYCYAGRFTYHSTEENEKVVGKCIRVCDNKDPFMGIEWLGSSSVKSYGMSCDRCGEYNEYVEKRDGFVCYGCSLLFNR